MFPPVHHCLMNNPGTKPVCVQPHQLLEQPCRTAAEIQVSAQTGRTAEWGRDRRLDLDQHRLPGSLVTRVYSQNKGRLLLKGQSCPVPFLQLCQRSCQCSTAKGWAALWGAFWPKNFKYMQTVILWTPCTSLLKNGKKYQWTSYPLRRQTALGCTSPGAQVKCCTPVTICVLQADVSSKNPTYRVTNRAEWL